LSGRVLQVRKVPQGQSVGYGAAWTAKRASRVAIAALGYADGLSRASSGVDRKTASNAIVAGKRCPIVGYISMDLACIDVTDLPDNVVRRGDSAKFIGDGLPIDEVAGAAGTIGYEVLVRLGSRCHLAYRGG
jgi:alanine racemase